MLQACSDSDNNINNTNNSAPITVPETRNLVGTAIEQGSFNTLLAAVDAAGLTDTLSDPSQNFTLFAPTDAAFAALGQDTIDALLADPDTLANILTYHVIGSRVDAAGAIASAGMTVEMVNGDLVGLSLDGNTLLVNTATVTGTDIAASNGVIHVIDAVLMPPADPVTPTMNIVETAVANGNFTTLVAALQATNLDATLADASQNFTVFAPTDSAFEMIGTPLLNALLDNPDMLRQILLQHVVPGEVNAVTAFTLNGNNAETASGAMIPIAINQDTDRLTFGGANIVITDIQTTNGIIHVIDTVVVAEAPLPTPPNHIFNVAFDNGNFTTLIAALEATGLDSVLADESAQFTVFAPTDTAFALLGQNAVDALLADTDALRNILLYHVISGSTILQDGAVTAAQSNMNTVTMANNQTAALSFVDSKLFINKSNVSAADVMASNGVIHVVDQVIIPPAIKDNPANNIVETALADSQFSTLVTALQTANLVNTLADANQTFTVFAPTNAAFDKIPDDALSGLLADNAALTQVLLQHVIIGAEVNSIAAFTANGTSVNTAANDDVTVRLVNFSMQAATENDEVGFDAANQRLVGGQNSANQGFTLYVFDNDLGSASSNCNDACATNWPPVIVADGSVSGLPNLGTITRADNSIQATFKGRPLYFFSGDTAVGDNNGDGVNNVWSQVNQAQVDLQIQGTGVSTPDVFTSNGVIHVIDTVITETLNP